MGSGANLQMEPGRSSREPPLDYQRWTKIGFSPPLPGPVRARVPRALGYTVLPLPRKNRRFSMGILFFCDLFPVRAAADGLYGSQYRRSRLALLHSSK